jgi:hypothetical protein
MTTSTTLLDWIMELFRDPEARAAFQADPEHYAEVHSLANASAADVHDALCLAVDHQPAHSHGHHDFHRPSPPHHHGEPAHHYLRHYMNDYESEHKNHTDLDDSVHQHIRTHGGDFFQHLDNDPVVASGDHSVAAGHGIADSTVTSGDGSVVGDNDHAATGDGDDTAFGSGDASRVRLAHADFGKGSSLSVHGDADGHHTDNTTHTAVHSSGSGGTSVTAAGAHGSAGHYADQHQSDDSTHSHYADDSRVDTHDMLNSHNDSHLSDSHNYDLHHI